MNKEDVFTKLIRDNEGIIFKISSMYTKDSQDHKDLYQDIVYQLWKSFDSFRQESKISTWLYRVAMNTAITQVKKENKSRMGLPIEDVVINEIQTDNVDLEEKIKYLYRQIHQLNPLEKGLILLMLEGKKHEEIAEITGLSRSNVGTRISRIKEKLKKKLQV